MGHILSLAVAAVLVAGGCGTERPRAVVAPGPSSSASAAPAPPSPATVVPPTAPDHLAGFPLARGLAPYADPDVEGPGRDVPGVFLETLCNSTTWPGPPAHRTDRLAVTEALPDWVVTRELVLYDSQEHARAVLAALRADVAGCPAAEGQPVTTYHPETGFDSVTYGTTGAGSGDGRTLVQVVRVGRAVVATSQFTDPSDSDVRRAVDELTGDLAPVTAEMACVWSPAHCEAYGE